MHALADRHVRVDHAVVADRARRGRRRRWDRRWCARRSTRRRRSSTNGPIDTSAPSVARRRRWRSARSTPFGGGGACCEQPKRLREREVRMVAAQDARTARRHRRAADGREDHRRRARRRRAAPDISGWRRSVRSPAAACSMPATRQDLDVAVSFEPAAQTFREIAKLQKETPGFLIRCIGRASVSVSAGLPACSHAPTMTPAVAVIASPSRCSRIGRRRRRTSRSSRRRTCLCPRSPLCRPPAAARTSW